MKHWNIDDLPWSAFRADKVDSELLRMAKAASMVEHNGWAYARYLSEVFHDDEEFKRIAWQWAEEEVQHGQALARWAKMADPEFDFEGAFGRFADTIRLPEGAARSVRGSRVGELVARCVVEVGTSSYYSALAHAAEEPVLKEICLKIAADELRHYKLFYRSMKQYAEREHIGFWRRLWVALGRVFESEDDELAYAYYIANDAATGPYDRKRAARAYIQRAYGYYRYGHVEWGMAMVFKAIGLKPHGRLNRALARVAYRFMRYRVQRFSAAEA
jgi:rubrerythrin